MHKTILLFIALFLFVGTPTADISAEVNVNVNVAAPPPLRFAAPPDVVVVPSGNVSVYMVPNMTGMYFYHGFWYRYHQGFWFRSAAYDGIWAPLERRSVPQVIVRVPPEYPRFLPHDYHRIHYNDFHGHWQAWDRDRHWRRYDWYKHESRADIRQERLSHIKKERATVQHRELRHNEKRHPPKDSHEQALKQGEHDKVQKHTEHHEQKQEHR
jgi:hypothetical protein